MGLFDRISRVVGANMNDLVSRAEDPEYVLEDAFADMQRALIQLRQAVATANLGQQRLEGQIAEAQSQASIWEQQVQRATQSGQKDSVRRALREIQLCNTTVLTLKSQLAQQAEHVATLKRNLVAFEGKVAAAQAQKNILKARAKIAKAREQLPPAVGRLDTDVFMAAFERIEENTDELMRGARFNFTEKSANTSDSDTASNSLIQRVEVTVIEEKEQANTQLIEIERQFAALEAEDDELAALRAELLGSPIRTRPTDANQSRPSTVDEELEALKRELDAL
ncbi:PspA/IM30 family protein [Synechococcus elongatus]|uniref:PspA/IM30 family protein n=1 Tax=Synechococcus elongatus TaxID=32046 RepID=UPI0030D34711